MPEHWSHAACSKRWAENLQRKGRPLVCAYNGGKTCPTSLAHLVPPREDEIGFLARTKLFCKNQPAIPILAIGIPLLAQDAATVAAATGSVVTGGFLVAQAIITRETVLSLGWKRALFIQMFPVVLLGGGGLTGAMILGNFALQKGGFGGAAAIAAIAAGWYFSGETSTAIFAVGAGKALGVWGVWGMLSAAAAGALGAIAVENPVPRKFRETAIATSALVGASTLVNGGGWIAAASLSALSAAVSNLTARKIQRENERL